MRIVIHGRHLEVTEAIRSYTEKKIGKVKKYFSPIIEVDVTLSAEHLKSGHHHTVNVLVHINGHVIKSSSSSTDLYVAIDEVTDILEVQVTKYKEKIKDNNHVGAVKRVKYDNNNKTIEKKVVRKIVETKLVSKPMDIEEAILQLEVLNQNFYVFMNSTTEELNIVYKRKDGDYGHVEKGWQ